MDAVAAFGDGEDPWDVQGRKFPYGCEWIRAPPDVEFTGELQRVQRKIILSPFFEEPRMHNVEFSGELRRVRWHDW